MPSYGRKPLIHILQETSNYDRQDEKPVRGRDHEDDKWRLQNKNAFGFGSALPTTGAVKGMVSSPLNACPGAVRRVASERRVTFTNVSPSSSPRGNGLTNEHERMVAEIAS